MKRLGWLLSGMVLSFVGGFLFGAGREAACVLTVGAGVVVMAVGAVVAAWWVECSAKRTDGCGE